MNGGREINMNARLDVVVRPDGGAEYIFTLGGVLFEEDGAWVSYCQALDLSTCGKSAEEALDRTSEAVALFIRSCLEHGTLHKTLRDLNWDVRENIDLDGLARRHPCPPQPSLPAFVIENIQRRDRSWDGRARYAF